MSVPFLADLQRRFADAGHRPLAQLATVSPEGMPEVRTVVLRGLDQTGRIWFATDRRSAKVRSLASRPVLELCLWWPEQGLQWRLRGPATVHANDALATSTWNALPADTRTLFDGPPPGRAVATLRAPGPRAGDVRAGDVPPRSFVTVLLEPARCDRLQLGPPLERLVWTHSAAGWQQREVVP